MELVNRAYLQLETHNKEAHRVSFDICVCFRPFRVVHSYWQVNDEEGKDVCGGFGVIIIVMLVNR